ncbi:unnamed protein product [Parascedosporium putredinis]|uniref:Xaa-Pro aminopeptidase n=1 Tax=Parascedosporium putredinis TaxID=1442378 RepID=A0A9P1H7V8_9PEZI|nr:unnamed protein product [Parascedosporium putredinis]CAI8000090.1 unnamed protein product [Parascedosporium putredinis]
MAKSAKWLAEVEEEFDFGLDLVDEFDALLVNVTSEEEKLAALGKFPAKLHARKVAAELSSQHEVSSGLIYLSGEPSLTYEDSDQAPPFRQRRYFYYLSGANFADCAVTYDIKTDHLVLWIPYIEPRKVLWYGFTPGPEECRAKSDVDDVRYIDGMKEYIAQRLLYGSADTLYLLHANHAPPLSADTRPKVRIDASSLRPCMDAARVVKSDYEVAMIRKANAVSSAAHRRAAELLSTFKNEREIEAVFRSTCALRGAKNQAYPVIAGSGENAATLHYEDNDEDLKGRQLVVIDAGCEWDCYASDVTRTLPISGRFSDEAAEIYTLVDKMQRECISAVRPGVLYYKLHLHAAAVALVGLMRLGILGNGTVGQIWSAGTIAAFFPHGLGHHIGLEVHDVTGRDRLLLLEGGESDGDAKDTSATDGRQRLEKNMIVTIEPGIYFCREYIEGYVLKTEPHCRYINKDMLEKYYPVGGVRIEDDILVTEDGYENLTDAPKGEELFRIINGKA